MINDKILKYRYNLALARKLARNKFANREYYQEMSTKLEKLLKFYEDLKMWDKLPKN